MANHIAFKCNYNNADEGFFVGFRGTCSDDVIAHNVKTRPWCMDKTNPCRKYYDAGFKRTPPKEPCFESVLFHKWKFGAGTNLKGERAGKPRHLSKEVKGKIAVCTTEFPGDKEKRIIGIFKIGKVDSGNRNQDTVVYADETFRVRLPIEVAKELYFYDYFTLKWKSGLFRYLYDNEQVHRMLVDLYAALNSGEEKKVIGELLQQDFPKQPPPPPSGSRVKRNKKNNNLYKRLAIKRKYHGTGGEGEAHKKLKKWIAENPDAVGLSGAKKPPEIEYVFKSGDVADIIFQLSDNRYAVVEIETEYPLPGGHQALKYRVLKCAELGLDIKSPDVDAILVAWSIPKEVKYWCNKYGIRCVEKKL